VPALFHAPVSATFRDPVLSCHAERGRDRNIGPFAFMSQLAYLLADSVAAVHDLISSRHPVSILSPSCLDFSNNPQ
jgi:hypothetical protein